MRRASLGRFLGLWALSTLILASCSSSVLDADAAQGRVVLSETVEAVFPEADVVVAKDRSTGLICDSGVGALVEWRIGDVSDPFVGGTEVLGFWQSAYPEAEVLPHVTAEEAHYVFVRMEYESILNEYSYSTTGSVKVPQLSALGRRCYDD